MAMAVQMATLLLLIACSGTKESANNKSNKQRNGGSAESVTEAELRGAMTAFMNGTREKLLGNFDKAMEYFIVSVELDPKNDASYYEMARIYAMTGDFNTAVNYAEQAANLSPSNIWYQSLLGQFKTQVGKYDQAVVIYKKLAADHYGNLDFSFDLATVYIAKGDYTNAIKVYDTIEQQVGLSEELAVQKQLLYMQLNKVDEAANEIRKLVESDPDEIRYYGMLAEVYDSAGTVVVMNEKRVGRDMSRAHSYAVLL
jgi:tetratricopeptide (TPR) repeat protein